jgi:hypothetical protein
MMGACGADDDVGVLLRQKFKKQRFQMIDDTLPSTSPTALNFRPSSPLANATFGSHTRSSLPQAARK